MVDSISKKKRICNKCNLTFQKDMEFCEKCGSHWTESADKCINPDCSEYGILYADGSTHCPKCGKSLEKLDAFDRF